MKAVPLSVSLLPAVALLYSHHLNHHPQTPPLQALVGPIAPRAGRADFEPHEAKAFLDGAKDGAVVVSFGSMAAFGHALSSDEFEALARGFADLAPVRVLWLLRSGSLPGGLTTDELPLGANTRLFDWVDTNDALGHPNTRLFVTHGGVHSTYEAAHHGVPIVGVPFQFEQAANVRRLAAGLGMGAVSPEAPATRRKGSKGYTREGVRALLAEVLGDPAYADAARRAGVAARALAAARPPLEGAVLETELAMAHRDYGRYAVAPRPKPKRRQQQQQQEEAGGGGGGGERSEL